MQMSMPEDPMPYSEETLVAVRLTIQVTLPEFPDKPFLYQCAPFGCPLKYAEQFTADTMVVYREIIPIDDKELSE
jgi:hypothetical protein